MSSKPTHRIRPTVCTNRRLDAIRECLIALGGAGLGKDTIVVLSGLAPAVADQRRREIQGVLPEASVVDEPAGGLSRARNLAVSVVADEDIVAFLDDDAVIGPLWLSSMTETWARANPRVAAVGGPIKPEFLAPRPPWLSDRLLGGLSIIDHGPEPRVLNGSFLYGANLAVLARQAQAVGGFDLQLGPLGRGPGFGDDIDIQLRMQGAGLEVLYVPEISVNHLIPPERLRRRAVLERRYAHGVDIARRTEVSQVSLILTSLRGMLSSATRTVLYTLARKPDLAMDHLAFAAQSIGVLRESAKAAQAKRSS